MRKRTYVLNRFSNYRTVIAGRFDNDVPHLDKSTNMQSYFLARKVSLKCNVAIDPLQNYKIDAKVTNDRWQDYIVLNQAQLFRLLISFVFLLFALFFQLYGNVSNFIISIIYLFSIVIGGYRLIYTGIRQILALRFDMQSLMLVPLIGLILLGHLLEGAVFVLLFSISEIIKAQSINIAKRSMRRFLSRIPREAVVQVGNEFVKKDITEVERNEVIVVDIGEQIPLDGLIISGNTTVNEKVITGQSNSSSKSVGDEVFAGCLNEGGKIFVKVKKLANETKLAHIVGVVESAQKTKAPVQHFIENFMAYYTPLVLLLAFFVATLPPLVAGAIWAEWIYFALAILVIAYPCSFIISTPITFITSLSNIANSGILLKDKTAIEDLSRVKGIAFDQIGTLTVGKPKITNVVSFIDDDEEQFIRLGASISEHSDHPFADTIVNLAKKKQLSLKNVLQFQSVEGKGPYGVIDGEIYTIGSDELLDEYHNIDEPILEQMKKFQHEGKSIVTLSTSTKLLGFFVLQDDIRPEAKRTIQQLKNNRIKQLFLLSEDNNFAATFLAEKLGIEHVFANLLPEMKIPKINKLRHLFSHIAFVSPNPEQEKKDVISHTAVNIANGARLNEAALEHADVAFLQDDLTKLPALIRFCKKTIRMIKNNIFIIFMLKILALLLIIPNLLTLWIAVSVDIIAMTIVLINTLRLTK